MVVTLNRVAQGAQGTFGVLIVDGYPFCVTLEDPDRNNDGIPHNEVGQSCIPQGRYSCVPYPSKKFGNTFLVESVPGRVGILFHAGNTHHNTEGCILLGEQFGVFADGTPGILYAVPAMKRFLRKLTGPFVLDVRNCW